MASSYIGIQKHSRSIRTRGGGAARISTATRIAAAVLTVVSAWCSAARTAHADAATCVKWHASGQREARAGHLKLASELFASCGSNESCPNPIRTECVELYAGVEKSTPTVIFAVTDAQGNDVTNVRVYSSDQLLAESLNGRAIAVDPGKHNFKFVLPSGEVLNNEVLVREGEKNRFVSAKVQENPQSRTKGPAVNTPEQTASPSSPSLAMGSSLPVGFWVSSGVGAAALASWGVFALLGRNQQSQLEACSPNCPPSRHDNYDAMRRDYLIADISLAAAVAGAGVATWLFISNKNSSSDAEESAKAHHVTTVSVLPSFAGPGASFVVNTDAF